VGTEPVGVQCIFHNHFPCVCLAPVNSIYARLFDTNPLCQPSILCMVFLASRFPPSSPLWHLDVKFTLLLMSSASYHKPILKEIFLNFYEIFFPTFWDCTERSFVNGIALRYGLRVGILTAWHSGEATRDPRKIKYALHDTSLWDRHSRKAFKGPSIYDVHKKSDLWPPSHSWAETGGGRSPQNLRWGRPMHLSPQYLEKLCYWKRAKVRTKNTEIFLMWKRRLSSIKERYILC